MCGIACIVNRYKPVSADDIRTMDVILDRMVYRGPDKKGQWKKDRILMGHRRLSIIDLSESGNQPFHDHTNRYHIIFNGEIYNYKEVKNILKQKGYTFQSNSDTEVILHAYDCYGLDFIQHLNGMFAFVLYDENRKKILLFRDRIGKKPVYYMYDEERLIVLSESKYFHAFSDFDSKINLESVGAFFSLQYIPGRETIYQNVNRLMPGEYIELDTEKWNLRRNQYWDLHDYFYMDDKESIPQDNLDSILESSVRQRLVSDVEVGVLLSGGIDSSLIAECAMQAKEEPIKAFTVSFEDQDLDELYYAKQVSDYLGMELIEIPGSRIDPNTFLKIVFHADEPLADPACIPTYLIAEAVSDYLKVVLSGEGADELFWGYPHYNREKYFHKLLNPAIIDHFYTNRYLSARLESTPQIPAFVSRFSRIFASEHDLGSSRWTTVFGESSLHRLFEDGHPHFSAHQKINDHLNNLKKKMSRLSASVSLDLFYWLPDDLLVKLDRMSMAHSVEARAPFLDQELIKYALNLPISQKGSRGQTKLPLRKLLGQKLPAELHRSIVYRKKHGFETPICKWMDDELNELASHSFNTASLNDIAFLNTREIQTLWNRFKKSGDSKSYGRKMWLLLCFISWYHLYKQKFGLTG